MYPAWGLGEYFTEEDLPDALTVTVGFVEDGFRTVTVPRIPKDGDTYYRGNDVTIQMVGSEQWGMTDFDTFTEYYASCLIGDYDQEGVKVEDQFADCYEVSRLYVVSGTLGSTYCPEFDTWVDHYVDEQEIENIVLVRSGLCNWTAIVTLNIYYQCPEDENRQIFSTDYPRVNLSYNPSGDGKLWSLTCDQPLNPGFSTKDGLQNHPGGTYDGTPFDDIIVTPVLCP
jgi:hypothetical protein